MLLRAIVRVNRFLLDPLFNRRVSFVIGADGRLLDIIKSELNMNVHADRALEVLKEKAGRREKAGRGRDVVKLDGDRRVRLEADEPKASRRN